MSTTTLKTLAVSIGTTLATIHFAHAAGLAEFDIEPRFQAKIAKEKAKQNSRRANNFNFLNDGEGQDDSGCGNQNIGNVQTGGRPGTAPREVFVFAPNAINLVSGQGCK